MTTPSSVYAKRIGALSWLMFAVMALLVLRVPFTGDQYFFALGAEALARGERLYIDFWDIKQPGIFYVYRFAAALPGDIALAVRILEIGCWALACVLARRVLLGVGVDRAVAATVPAMLGATYFATAPAWHLSQIESFAILPLMVCASCAARPTVRRIDWCLLGFATAIVAWFKLVLVLMPAAMALVMLQAEWRHLGTRAGLRILADVGAAATAFVITIALLLAPFWSMEALAALYEVTWLYPTQQMHGVADAPASRLLLASLWFVSLTAPLCVLAALIVRFRPGSPVVRVACAWLVAAVACVLLQRFSWWAYHTTLFRPAIVLLALLTIDRASTWLLSMRPAAVALVASVLTVGLSLPALVRKSSVLPDSLLAPTPSPRFENRVAPGYERLRQQATFIRDEYGDDASLCVLGDTALAYHSRSQCGMALRMWSAPALSDLKWRQFATELRTANPKLIYLSGSEADVLRRHQPEVLEWIGREYFALRPGMPGDTWYISRTAESRSRGHEAN